LESDCLLPHSVVGSLLPGWAPRCLQGTAACQLSVCAAGCLTESGSGLPQSKGFAKLQRNSLM
jgi:hypothetical protein